MAQSSYGAASEEVIDLFGNYFSGSSEYPFLIVSYSPLGSSSVDALQKSFSTLGFKDPAYSTIVIAPPDIPVTLDSNALRLLIEGIDPYRIICADIEALNSLNEAYRLQLVPNAINRIAGRTSGVFSNLEESVQNSTEKFRVWEILKALK